MSISNAYPNILQNGAAADATQVMSNFYQIQNDVNANAATNGANSNITSLTGLTTPLGLAYGGTGQTSAAAAFQALAGGGNLTGGLTIDNVTITNNLLVNDAVIFNGSLGVTGAITASGGIGALNISTTGSASVGTSLTVTGNTTLNGGTNTIANAVLTSSAIAPTPSANDSSTKIATTAFVNTANSLAASGYQKLVSGLIFQWGTCPSSSNATVTFPISFPNACFGVQGTGNTVGGGFGAVSSITQSNFLWHPGSGVVPGYYFAYGY